MKMSRYYSRLRPVSIGTCPSDAVYTFNYNDRKYVEEAGCEVWGFAEYERELTEEECKQYDLVPGGLKTYWVTSTTVDDYGNVRCKLIGSERHTVKPQSVSKSTKRRDIYIDYFDSREEAEEFVNDADNA